MKQEYCKYHIWYVYLCRDSTHRLSSQSILGTIIQVLHGSGSQLHIRRLAIILAVATGVWCGNDLNIGYGRSVESTTCSVVVVIVLVLVLVLVLTAIGKATALRVTVTAIVTVTVMMLDIRTKHLRDAAKYGAISPFALRVAGHVSDCAISAFSCSIHNTFSPLLILLLLLFCAAMLVLSITSSPCALLSHTYTHTLDIKYYKRIQTNYASRAINLLLICS